jgi:hypothetical protein
MNLTGGYAMTYEIFTSELTPVADTIILEVGSRYAHSFAGIRYFDAQGDQVLATGGTVLVEAKHLTNGMFDSVVRGTLDATSPASEAQWGGNVTEVRATPSSIVGAVTYQLIVVQNRS